MVWNMKLAPAGGAEPDIWGWLLPSFLPCMRFDTYRANVSRVSKKYAFKVIEFLPESEEHPISSTLWEH